MAKDNYIPKIISVRQMEAYLRFASGFTGSGAVKEPKRRDIGVMTEENHGLEQAKAQFASIKEMVETFNKLTTEQNEGWPREPEIDAAERAIREDPLSVMVRSGWVEPGSNWDNARGAVVVEPVEYEILLCTGGPAVRIRGDLDRGTPTSARLEHQDWFKPWTQYHCDQDVLLAYASHFWFGE